MYQSFIHYFSRASISDLADFKKQKFNQNNIRILLIATFLVFEQLFYGLFISDKGSLLREIYFGSSFLMFIYFWISIYLYFNKPEHITILHIFYETSIAFIGLMVAITRIMLIQHEVFHLPTVYIAVIYATSFIFYYNYKQSFFIYFFSTLILINLLFIFRPSLQFDNYVADITSNSLIAWIVSMVNYRKYMKEYNNVKIIEEKNQKLEKKNEKIEEINNKLHNISITDELTGIYNRRKIEDVLKRVFVEARRYDKKFSIIICDLDHFKKINDKFGHLAGDKVLKKLSNLIQENIREADTCGRWGGEEFLIICPETDINSAFNLAKRLKNLVEETVFLQDESLTASFGVASCLDKEKIKDLIKRADDNLYRAKEEGRNIVICIEP